jgi:hypothetical protein
VLQPPATGARNPLTGFTAPQGSGPSGVCPEPAAAGQWRRGFVTVSCASLGCLGLFEIAPLKTGTKRGTKHGTNAGTISGTKCGTICGTKWTTNGERPPGNTDKPSSHGIPNDPPTAHSKRHDKGDEPNASPKSPQIAAGRPPCALRCVLAARTRLAGNALWRA